MAEAYRSAGAATAVQQAASAVPARLWTKPSSLLPDPDVQSEPSSLLPEFPAPRSRCAIPAHSSAILCFWNWLSEEGEENGAHHSAKKTIYCSAKEKKEMGFVAQ